MTLTITNFTDDVRAIARTHSASPTEFNELNTIATALGTDPTLHDKTIEVAPAGLQSGNVVNTKFTNAVLRIVNMGKGGNLTPAAMGTAISSGIAGFLPPVNTVIPAVTGAGTVGQTLTCDGGSWNNYTTLNYSWYSGGAYVGAGPTRLLTASDGGKSVYCYVTAINGGGQTGATSNSVAVQGIPVNSVAPVASGTGTVGQILSTTTGTWSNAPTSYTYQWLRGGVAIAGATVSTYTLAAADSATNVSCRVAAVNAAGTAAGVVSNAIPVT